MPAPLEIIAIPFQVYIGPVGESFPDTDETPAGNWVLIGTGGNLNYSEDGVRIQKNQTNNPWRALGSTGYRKVFRSAEEVTISITLVDFSLENYKYSLDFNTVTDVPAASGVPGYRHISLYRGLSVDLRSLLIRLPGGSPYQEGANAQYEIPVCFENGSPEILGTKENPISLALEYMALEDPNAASTDLRHGRLVAQDADAL